MEISDTTRRFYDNMSTSSVDQILKPPHQKVLTSTKFEDDTNEYQLKTNGKGDVIFVPPDKNEKLKDEISIKSLQSILDVINKIRECKNLKQKQETLKTYTDTYKLLDEDVEFIIKQTGMVIEVDPENLRTFDSRICSDERLQKFFYEEKKTRRNWINTKKIILFRFLSIQVKNQDEVDIDTAIAKLFLFDERKDSPYNDFTGFAVTGTENKDEDGKIFKHKEQDRYMLLYLINSTEGGRTWSQKYKDVENVVVSAVKDAVRKTGESVVQVTKSIGSTLYDYGSSFLTYANPWKFVYGDGTIHTMAGNQYLVMGESNDKNGPFDGGLIFFLKYVDHVLNNCLKKNIQQNNWRWEIDLDDLVPLMDCEKYKKCMGGKAEGVGEPGKGVGKGVGKDAFNEDEMGEASADGSNRKEKKQIKRSLKILKKQCKEGLIEKKIYKQRSRDLKNRYKQLR